MGKRAVEVSRKVAMSLSTARGKQRKHALRVLFEIDLNGVSLEEVLECKKLSGEQLPGDFGLRLVNGVIENRSRIDEIIAAYAEGWEIERMPTVDRNILRIALFEILFSDESPPAVAINEAVELAKVFSTEESGRFINGMLGRIYRDSMSGKLLLP